MAASCIFDRMLVAENMAVTGGEEAETEIQSFTSDSQRGFFWGRGVVSRLPVVRQLSPPRYTGRRIIAPDGFRFYSYLTS